MTERPLHRVTRGYALALVAAVAIVAVSLLIMTWGLLSLWLGTLPVTSEVPPYAGPLLVVLAVGVLVWSLWHQTLTILRGLKPTWGLLVIVPGLAYLVWSLGGTIAGMSIAETWISLYALALALIWAVALLLFWAVFMRRVYTDRPPPRWPWEWRDALDELGDDDGGDRRQ